MWSHCGVIVDSVYGPNIELYIFWCRWQTCLPLQEEAWLCSEMWWLQSKTAWGTTG